MVSIQSQQVREISFLSFQCKIHLFVNKITTSTATPLSEGENTGRGRSLIAHPHYQLTNLGACTSWSLWLVILFTVCRSICSELFRSKQSANLVSKIECPRFDKSVCLLSNYPSHGRASKDYLKEEYLCGVPTLWLVE